MPNDEMMTVGECCAFLKIGRRTFDTWREKDIAPPCFKVGGRVFVRRSVLMQWINEQEAEAA